MPCGQCIRARLDCSGYRDVDQLRIRDETESIIAKALPSSTRSRDGHKGSKPKTQATSSSIESTQLPITTLPKDNDLTVRFKFSTFDSIQPLFVTPIEDQARNAFFFHYVTHDLRTYSYLETYYSSGSDPSETQLSASVDAVSLAFFSHWANSALGKWPLAPQMCPSCCLSKFTMQSTRPEAGFVPIFAHVTCHLSISSKDTNETDLTYKQRKKKRKSDTFPRSSSSMMLSKLRMPSPAMPPFSQRCSLISSKR